MIVSRRGNPLRTRFTIRVVWFAQLFGSFYSHYFTRKFRPLSRNQLIFNLSLKLEKVSPLLKLPLKWTLSLVQLLRYCLSRLLFFRRSLAIPTQTLIMASHSRATQARLTLVSSISLWKIPDINALSYSHRGVCFPASELYWWYGDRVCCRINCTRLCWMGWCCSWRSNDQCVNMRLGMQLLTDQLDNPLIVSWLNNGSIVRSTRNTT